VLNRDSMMKIVLALALAAAPLAGAAATPAHYVSQRGDKAYLREGPSYAHRVLWVYRHKGTPFRVGTRYDVWRKVTAADGTTGWMSAAMLTDRRTVLVTGKGRVKIFARADGDKLVGLA
jgi:SH3-like domain-containing protein